MLARCFIYGVFAEACGVLVWAQWLLLCGLLQANTPLAGRSWAESALRLRPALTVGPGGRSLCQRRVGVCGRVRSDFRLLAVLLVMRSCYCGIRCEAGD
jgi:hypothetical protein